MCLGYFAPPKGLLRANALLLYNNKISDVLIDFLIDTGADATMLSPQDAMRIGIDISSLDQGGEISGVGGSIETRVLKDVGLIFINPDNNKLELECHLEFCENLLVGPDGWTFGSILGRDVTNRFNMNTDIENSKFSLTRIESNPNHYEIFSVPLKR
ncbi:MAG: retropepsin-like domain-containing protein [Methanotrichaceae archaeon]|nr:retropepsin-like domain-containing protein [Methanotrichaceae archaeon]